MDELQRVVQDLSRDEDINVSVNDLVNSFKKSKEVTLTDEIWGNLENTESNEIEKGDMDSVINIAKMYKKTNPKKLSQSIKSGDYKRPLILKFGDRYHLVAGNTRLCTAAAMGVNPKVFIGSIDSINKTETKESTDAGSSGSFSGPVFGENITKREIYKIHNAKLHEEVEMEEATDASSSGSYDVPLFGKTPKGNRNPLKIDGPDSIYKGRSVKDKKFPKYGGPNGIYVKVKEKCKKFPYCNQGNTGALEFIKEDKEINEAINEISKKYGIPRNEVEKIVLNDINQIFI